ncbi:MAG TPA: GNAT family N-acetyltransferase [Candidatus Babeliales bacterium]|nr:GNAT family N-acetyltransferase [Candidatus Babeliales bacterium]
MLKIITVVLGCFMVGSVVGLPKTTITVNEETDLIIHNQRLVIQGFITSRTCELNCIAPDRKEFNDYGRLRAEWDDEKECMVMNQLNAAIQGHGIGSALLQTASRALKDAGFTRMKWRAEPNVRVSTLPQLIAFYTKNGGTMVRERSETAEFKMAFN